MCSPNPCFWGSVDSSPVQWAATYPQGLWQKWPHPGTFSVIRTAGHLPNNSGSLLPLDAQLIVSKSQFPPIDWRAPWFWLLKYGANNDKNGQKIAGWCFVTSFSLFSPPLPFLSTLPSSLSSPTRIPCWAFWRAGNAQNLGPHRLGRYSIPQIHTRHNFVLLLLFLLSFSINLLPFFFLKNTLFFF